jgi:hypothetical protein
VIIEFLSEVMAIVEDAETARALLEVRLNIQAIKIDHIYES